VEITATQDVAAVVLYSNIDAGGSYFFGIAAVDPTNQTENYSPTQFAVVATVAADWSSGAHSLIPADKPRIAQNNLLPTISDIGMAAYEKYFYRIELFMADNVTKFDINAPTTPIWQYSTLGDDLSSNPYDLIFVSDTKAYLLRYDTTTAWVVNPSAASEAEFKIGELDLSAYGDADGLPEMNAGVIVRNKLFITMQRLDRTDNWIAGTAYVAVFDTTTDTEIDTGFLGGGELMGISLPIKNPGTILYLADNDTLYVQGVGGFESSWSGIPADYSGGIASIDPGNYETTMILDDGDDNDHPYGNISGLQIVSATKGYFIGYAGWGDNTLYSFDPSTGEVDGAVAGLENKNISGMESGAYIDNNNMLWICNQTDAEVVLLDTGDDTIDERISTNLNPRKIVFCEP
ncbi:MAG: hypothetical protein J7M06_00985, partial [Proteobacteria bacterium]|nr:hypothetical protein [Pseudomonadota bacterium]